MNSPFQGTFDPPGSPLKIDPDEANLQLTPEELNILKHCNTEGIQKRGIPFGLAFGFISHLAAKKKGILNHPKFGSIPFVVSSAFVGYFSGRLSYFPVCYQRLMNVPNGVFREKALKGAHSGSMRPQVGQVPLQVDPTTTYTQSRPTDIDTLTTSTFDTMPSNLDSDTPQLPAGPLSSETPQRYTTYDELRERNRREYMNKTQRSGYPQSGYPPAQPGYPPQQPGYPPLQSEFQGEPMVPPGQPQIPSGQPTYQRKTRVPVQPGEPEMTQTQNSGPIPRKVKTKYGDEWEY